VEKMQEFRETGEHKIRQNPPPKYVNVKHTKDTKGTKKIKKDKSKKLKIKRK